MTVDLKGFQIYKEEKRELVSEMKHTEARTWETAPLVANFLAAIRSRRHTDLTVGVEEVHVSAALCHMANVSYPTGRVLGFDPKGERFVGDTEGNRYMSREYRKPFVVPEKI